jgi:hypothetical protein
LKLIIFLFTASIFFGIQKKLNYFSNFLRDLKTIQFSIMNCAIMPNLPVNIVNRIIRDAAILHGEKSIPKFTFSKAKQQYIYRAKFRKRYLKKFVNVERLLRFKVNNPPEFTLILPTTWTTPFMELNKFRDCLQTPEERHATVSRMRPATIVKFPLVITRRPHSWYEDEIVEERSKYSYCTFENGHVFIKKNESDEDDDDYMYGYSVFYRGYISLDGSTFPIFDMPVSLHNYQETPDQNPHGIDNCTQIKYLEKELGPKVRIIRDSQTNYEVYDEATQKWNWSQEYSFTPQEARFLVPYYEEPEPDYGYYSD